MTQERLSALAILVIEKEEIDKLDFEELIDSFASKLNRVLQFF